MRIRFRTALIATVVASAVLPARTSAAAMPGYLRPVRGPIIRHFEPPPTRYAAGHRGIDLAVPVGSPIVASNAGTVAFAGAVAGQLYISIDHADGIRTTYSYVSLISVRRGDVVARGQRIGLSGPGDPGTPQPCLHFGMRVGETYLDPEAYLIDGLRRDVSQAIRLAPDDDGSGGPVAARDSIPAAQPILVGALALRAGLRHRRSRADHARRGDPDVRRDANRRRPGVGRTGWP